MDEESAPVRQKMCELADRKLEQEIEALKEEKARRDAEKPKPEPMPEGVISFQQIKKLEKAAPMAGQQSTTKAQEARIRGIWGLYALAINQSIPR